MKKTIQKTIRVSSKTNSELQQIKILSYIKYDSAIIELAVEKLLESLKKNNYDLNKLEV